MNECQQLLLWVSQMQKQAKVFLVKVRLGQAIA